MNNDILVNFSTLLIRCNNSMAELKNIVKGGHGSVMVKYHTFQIRGQGFKPPNKHFFPNFWGPLAPPKPYVAPR